MPDKKLTDNEIIKALECCLLSNEQQEERCGECPMYETPLTVCQNLLSYHALNLINRQKAVIEELGKRTNIKKVILPFINEKGKMVERTFNVDINCLEEGDHDD